MQNKIQELLDHAFGQARKRAERLPKMKNKFKRVRIEETTKIKAAADALAVGLDVIVEEFPDFSKLHPFYAELFDAIVSVAELKKALAHISDAAEIIKRLKHRKIYEIGSIYRKTETERMSAIRNEFYGRAASIVNDLQGSFGVIENARSKLKEKPEIKFDLPTVIIAGFPNVGKTTILKRLTGSEPEIAPYPFTTKSIKLGYFKLKYEKIQVIDTPGLLDRPMEKRNAIERKAVIAIRHLANAIVFVLDATTYSGYKLGEQMHLLKEIKGAFEKVPLIAAINKADLASKEEIENAKNSVKEIGINEIILCGEGIGDEALKERIIGEVQRKLLCHIT